MMRYIKDNKKNKNERKEKNMCENLIIYEDSFEIDQVKYPLDKIRKVSILNEDAKYKGKTKPFSHQVLSGVTMLMPIAANPTLYVGLRIVLDDDSMHHVYISEKPVQINSDAYFADRKEAECLSDLLEQNRTSSVRQAEKNDPIL